jgi:site-specific recombinase XerD
MKLSKNTKAGVGIRVIQKITGHAKLEQLSTYIEVSEEEVIAALESL